MRRLRADLHVHSVLSPCAMAEMTPRAIVDAARARDLALIAVCDHNAAGNVEAVQRAARGLAVVAGIEVTTREEAHVLGLFAGTPEARAVAAVVGEMLPELGAPPSWAGPQLLVDAEGNELSREPRMLSAACRLSLADAVTLIHAHGGLAIAAHVDRPSFSVTSQLGFVPADVPWDALELSAAGARRPSPFAALGFPLVCSSDAHSLDEIGAACALLDVEEPTFDELRLALRGREGRRCALATAPGAGRA